MRGIDTAIFMIICATSRHSYAKNREKPTIFQRPHDYVLKQNDSDETPYLHPTEDAKYLEAKRNHALSYFYGSGGKPGVRDENEVLYDKNLDGMEKLRRGLIQLVLKFDRDGDRYVTRKELVQWFERSFRVLYEMQSENQFVNMDVNIDGKVSFEEFLWIQYGYKLRAMTNITNPVIYQQAVVFLLADTDTDGALTGEEFFGFSHPQERPRVRRDFVKQHLRVFDKNRDGFVSLEEYFGSLLNKETARNDDLELKQDSNNDKRLSVRELLRREYTDHGQRAMEEAHDLIYRCDDDRDGVLSYEEILEHVVDVTNHRVTHFGDHLNYIHRFRDEL